MSPHARLGAACALSLIALGAGGCLVSSTSATEESGVRVTPMTMEQVEPGRTTTQWLVATLGEPTSKVPVEGEPGVEIWRYDYTKTERSAGAIFLIFGGASSRTEVSRAFFEVSNGVVTRYWREG